ncbi:MAG TPA: metal ABC transporter permease [Methylomirabilota bacterium]|nr:metal ABC transporter permease [Methylomirabilota bacterium]
MDLLRDLLGPDSLYRNTVAVGLLIGVACPLVGVYLVLRRLIFLGLALPQVSSCGIAAAFALHAWHLIPHLDDSSERSLAFFGSTVFTLGAILLLSALERRGGGLVEGRVGTAYVLAGAWSILLLVKNPYGEHGLLERLKGEIVAVSGGDLALTAATLALVVVALLVFRKELLLVAYDREMAIALRKNVALWDLALFIAIGLAVSMSVLSVGPLVTFGFLLLPPLTARGLARSMGQLWVLAPAIGAAGALGGFWIAYRWDLPVGPTDVALLGLMHGLVFAAGKLVRRPRAVA